jgi:hypothetical protein
MYRTTVRDGGGFRIAHPNPARAELVLRARSRVIEGQRRLGFDVYVSGELFGWVRLVDGVRTRPSTIPLQVLSEHRIDRLKSIEPEMIGQPRAGWRSDR